MSILITGYNGNVGKAVGDYLDEIKMPYQIGVRSTQKYLKTKSENEIRTLNFEDVSTFNDALKGIESVFLMRPPKLTDVKGIFEPFISACVSEGVKHIVFLSLLGVEKNPFPPHHKIEKIIENSGIEFTFIRPSFFMQNLIEPHAKEIVERDEVYIPSGKANISFIDTRDIGEIIGKCLIYKKHRNQKYTITGSEAIDYYEVAKQLSTSLGRSITYANPSLLRFRKDAILSGVKKEYATVMTVLYLTTKLGMANHVTQTAYEILGRPPRSIQEFIEDHKAVWNQK